ncbi:MAG: hypothetical protein Q7S44_04390 [bacterium]|nr:hypothetical protein [bacterium]
MKISDINLRIISDSRGEDTLEAEMFSGEEKVVTSVPSGKSKGSGEAVVLPPHLVLHKLEWIKSRVCNREFSTLGEFDDLLLTLDGTADKSSLGGNLMLVLSMAFTKLLAKKGRLETFELIAKLSRTTLGKFPLCFYNLIEGGVHVPSTSLRASLPFQEYLYIPQTNSPKESLEMVQKVIKLLGEKIHTRHGKQEMGDEGGYALSGEDSLLGLMLLEETQEELGMKHKIGLDIAASTFFSQGKYKMEGKMVDNNYLGELYQGIVEDFPLFSIEDPFAEEDWQGFEEITKKLGDKIWIVGDDLTTTNPRRIREAYEKQAINAVIVKPTQIGTVSETIQAALLAKSYGWKIIVSHRGRETMDTFIADLAVGLGADGFKSGSPTQKTRLVKYQRLVEIERSLK